MNKLISLLFMASGSVTYLPTPTSHELFTLTRFKGVLLGRKKFYRTGERFYPMSVFKQSCFVVRQLPKNKPVSLLESLPGKGIQYVRSTGTKAVILKMDSRVSTALVKLPSGVKKVFSTFSIGSLGGVALPENRKTKNTSAGFYKKHGKKSKVRGVAMNPVDHPHGGRAKAIRYQRTPWGKTTKYK
jgi:ribosomal protein L2